MMVTRYQLPANIACAKRHNKAIDNPPADRIAFSYHMSLEIPRE
jgi:hypothetical protein